MPPSPASRYSPGREHRVENTHKRGRSSESGLTVKSRDDDLVLFTDMQNKEQENSLLQPADDFDDSLTKLRCLSGFKLGITIPARGESSDLLNVDGEKNDYDWLLTPPDTPLFPSLDDEDPQPHNLSPRGRPRSQPINISRSLSMNEKPRRSSRGSASPHRLSPSPRSSNNFGPRPSSATRCSPPPIVRPATPSRRPSTPPNKPTSPTPRSSTPTLRRMSTGSSGQASTSGRRGVSPVRASRGNSASPKLRGWQSNLPGFSSDAPPNLRTSLADRPLPNVRGLSPTPRSGRGRQSMSPTASRSASSSHSNDRDLFSSYSKGSVVSSGDDDLDSLHSTISSSPPARRNAMSLNNRSMMFSKKPSRSSPSNSVPKRSFEPVLRQTEHRKTPQNMFRPLLSSVPATTFFVGKGNSSQKPLFSRNSSLTTTTSASSDQGASLAPDIDGSEHDQNDLAASGEWERAQDHDTQEVFMFDKADGIIETNNQELHVVSPLSGSGSCDTGTPTEINRRSLVNSGGIASKLTSEVIDHTLVSGDSVVVDGCEIISICCKCGKRFHVVGVDGETDLCKECAEMDKAFAAKPFLLTTVIQHKVIESGLTVGTDAPVSEKQLNTGVPNLPERNVDDVIIGECNNMVDGLCHPDNDCSVLSSMDQLEPQLSDQQLHRPQDAGLSYNRNKSGQTEPRVYSSPSIDDPEGTGISVLLLQPSNSSKWPVVQSRALSATNIHCAEPSYVRDAISAMRRSFGRDSASATSSVDLGSSKQTDFRTQRQGSSRRVETDSVRSDTDAKSQCSGSHSGYTVSACEPSVLHGDDKEESFNISTEHVETEALLESVVITGEVDRSLDLADTSAVNFSPCRAGVVDGDTHVNGDYSALRNTCNPQLLGDMERHNHDTSAEDNLKDEDYRSMDADDPWRENGSSLDIEPDSVHGASTIAEETMVISPACRSDVPNGAVNSSSVVNLEPQTAPDSCHELQAESGPSQISSNLEVSCEQSTVNSEVGMAVSSLEDGQDNHAHGLHEESTVIVEGPRGQMSRSLTLAEATDTILYCSSIIHDIAYKAAAIGMEKELLQPPEACRPTVTTVGKSINEQKDLRKVPGKHTPKSQKFKRKKLETPTKSPLTESGNNVIVHGSATPQVIEIIPKKVPDSTKPPKLESKCNCTVM